MSNTLERPTRTAVQSGFSVAIVEFLDALVVDISDRQYLAAVVLLTIVLGWLQVVIENKFGTGFLRYPDE